jgi:hypothetical protein
MLESNTDASTLDMSVRIRCWDCGCDRKAGCRKYGRGGRGGCLHELYDVHTLQDTSRRRSQLVSTEVNERVMVGVSAESNPTQLRCWPTSPRRLAQPFPHRMIAGLGRQPRAIHSTHFLVGTSSNVL